MDAGLKFLLDRGLTIETIKAFNLGYCDSSGLIHGRSFPIALNATSSRYRNGVLIPVYDLYGTPLNVQVRQLSGGNKKYDTPAGFKLHQHLFAVHKAIPHMVRSGWVVLTEGPFDAMVLHQFGVKNAVALFGTQLTHNQFCLLSRFVKNWLIVLDGDAPGRAAANKIKDFGKRYSVRSRVISLPPTEDPNSFLLKHGRGGWEKLCGDYYPSMPQGQNTTGTRGTHFI